MELRANLVKWSYGELKAHHLANACLERLRELYNGCDVDFDALKDEVLAETKLMATRASDAHSAFGDQLDAAFGGPSSSSGLARSTEQPEQKEVATEQPEQKEVATEQPEQKEVATEQPEQKEAAVERRGGGRARRRGTGFGARQAHSS